MEEEDGRKIGVKSRPNRRRPRKAGVKFILVCPALPNFFFFERSGKKVQTDGENEKNTLLRTINLSGPPTKTARLLVEQERYEDLPERCEPLPDKALVRMMNSTKSSDPLVSKQLFGTL